MANFLTLPVAIQGIDKSFSGHEAKELSRLTTAILLCKLVINGEVKTRWVAAKRSRLDRVHPALVRCEESERRAHIEGLKEA